MDFSTACMSGCVQPDQDKAFSCAWKCKGKADELRKQCWELVNKQGVDPKNAVAKVYPARKKGSSGNPASGQRILIHNGKIFLISEEKWKRRVTRHLPHDMGAFYDPNEIDFLRMDWAADSAVILTGVGTAAAVSVGVMTGGTAIVIGAGVTFVASGLKTFVEQSSSTLDVEAAALEGAKAGAVDAAVGTVFDGLTIGAAGGAKVVFKEAYKKTAKQVVKRKVTRQIANKAVKAVTKSKPGKAVSKLYNKMLKDPLVVRLERKLVMAPKGGEKAFKVQRVFTSKWDKNMTVTVLTGQDAAADGLETGLSNRVSNELSNVGKQMFGDYWDGKWSDKSPGDGIMEPGRVGDSPTALVITHNDGGRP